MDNNRVILLSIEKLQKIRPLLQFFVSYYKGKDFKPNLFQVDYEQTLILKQIMALWESLQIYSELQNNDNEFILKIMDKSSEIIINDEK